MRGTSSLYILLSIYLVWIQSGTNALAHPPQEVLAPPSQPHEAPVEHASPGSAGLSREYLTNNTAKDLLYALDVMQDDYFRIWEGRWPSANDWTATVMATHVSATLASLTSTVGLGQDDRAFENLINHFFDQVTTFYFGEHAVSLMSQAYDDMLWVVLDWLENIKFQALHSELHYGSSFSDRERRYWHGTQFRVPAAHRARLFYGLASVGWDRTLCGGGMIWNPRLTPYKNAITNELYISASVGMYLYFPGDTIESPFPESTDDRPYTYPHDPADLKAAIEAYTWLKNSNMTGEGGLYADGFHISGWEGVKEPGTRECDVLNTMVYTYNQGVILSGLRGLWMATLSQDYLRDAHDLMEKVIRATGWPNTYSDEWAGLGRGGVLEDACDSSGNCSQDGQTFKGIFFHHLAELCRPLRPQEYRFLESHPKSEASRDWRFVFHWHQSRCALYRAWIEHNAQAALVTRNEEGQFGMWWGRPYGAPESIPLSSPLPPGAVDYRNHMTVDDEDGYLYGLERTRKSGKNRPKWASDDPNDRGRGRTVETQAGGVAVLRALHQWKTSPLLW